jgi:translocation and assembly module TamB
MKWLLRLLAALVVAMLMVVGAGVWLIGTESGTRWLAERAEAATDGRLALRGVHGALVHTMGVERILWSEPALEVEARGVRATADLRAILAGRIVLEQLSADAVAIRTQAREAPTAELPEDIGLPMRIEAASMTAGEVLIEHDGMQHRFERLSLAYAGDRDGHQVRDLHVATPWGPVALDAALGAQKPFAVSAAGSIARPHERYASGAALEANGSLERLEIALTLNVAEQAVARGTALVMPFDVPWLAALDLRADAIDLSRVDGRMPRTALSARINARGTTDQGLAGTLVAENRPARGIDPDAIPVRRLETRFRTDFRRAWLEELRIALARGGTLAGRGQVSPERARLTLRAEEGIDAHIDMALDAPAIPFTARLMLQDLDPARLGEYPQGALTGTVDVRGQLAGPLEIEARWTVTESRLHQRPVASRGSARLTAGRVRALDAQATLGANRLGARGAFGEKGDRLDWSLNAPRLEEIDPRLAGRAKASGTLTGSWEDPRIGLTAEAHGLKLPDTLEAKSLSAKASFGRTREAPLELDLSGAAIRTRNIELARIAVRASGTVAQHELSVAAAGNGADVRATARGGLSDAGEWSGQVLSLVEQRALALRLLEPVRLEASRERVALGRFAAALAEGRILVRELVWEERRLSSRGEFSGLPAQWLIRPAGLSDRVRSTLRLDGQWSLHSTPQLSGEATLRAAGGDITVLGHTAVELGLQRARLDARFLGGEVAVSVDAAMRLGHLSLVGQAAPLPGGEGLAFGPESQMSFQARLAFADLRTLAQPFLTQARIDGRLSAELQGTGTLGKPVITGTVRGDQLRLDVPPHGIYLRDGRLRASLRGDVLEVAELMLQGGEGRIVAAGTVSLANTQERRLAWRAEQLRLLNRPDMRLVLSGKGMVRFDGERLKLTGEARADRAFVELGPERLPRLGDDVVVVGAAAEPGRERAPLPLELEADVDLGDQFAVRGRGFDGRLEGQLRVVGAPQGELLAYGKVRAVNASFLAYGRKLEVDPGTLIFDGPLDNPSLQITAWRRNQPVEAGVQLTGSAQAPNVRLVSSPPVPEGERLSWLVLGRAPTEMTGADLGLLQTAAGALLGRGDAVPVTDRIARAAGLDELVLRGGNELTEGVVAFGKRLSDRLYVTYEQGLGAAATNLIKLDFSLTDRLSLRAETGTASGWGLFYRFSWD